MPASYAHYRFGKLVLPGLPADVRQCVQRFRRMYDMGLQGPDIFFYYNPFVTNSAEKLASRFHGLSGQAFFSQAVRTADSEAARAYLYGLLAHYCLDAACHPFVNQMEKAGEARHIPLESEFERYLMAQDGIAEPHRYDVTRFMKLTRGECMTVARFYPTVTGGMVSRSLFLMTRCLRFLRGGSREQREKLLKKASASLAEHFIPTEPVAAWSRMDSELLARFNRGLRQYPELLRQLEESRKADKALGEDFAPIFG